MQITAETLVNAPTATVRRACNSLRGIVPWHGASPGRHAPRTTLDLRRGVRDCRLGFGFKGSLPPAPQRQGRQAILDNFARHVHARG